MHVFVETNWVFDCFAPKHRRKPAAKRLLESASRGAFRLHVPSDSDLSPKEGSVIAQLYVDAGISFRRDFNV